MRAPARIDRDFFFPASEPFVIRGGPDFVSETAEVLELFPKSGPPGTEVTVKVPLSYIREEPELH